MTTPGQRRSRRQERDRARELGGAVTPGSGNGWVRKNDVLTPRHSIECKTTAASSYRLTAADLKIAQRNALLAGREMAFLIDIAGSEYAVVTIDHFRELAEAWDAAWS